MWTIVNFNTNVTLFINFIIINLAYDTSVKNLMQSVSITPMWHLIEYAK